MLFAQFAEPIAPVLFREGETRVEVFNSGLEVWLYDNGNSDTIRQSNAMSFDDDPVVTENFKRICREGLLTGYKLYQDGGLDVTVIVGDPLTEAELASARWLAPQEAYLQLPTGELCIESNDACRLLDEEPMDDGARLVVAAGNYQITLYRIDYEAMEDEELEWEGPQEVIVLTPQQSTKQVLDDLLPWVGRSTEFDISWVGQYVLRDKDADVMVACDNQRVSVNLNRMALEKLGVSPGAYLKITVPRLGVDFFVAYGASKEESLTLARPAGLKTREFCHGAIVSCNPWLDEEVLYCARTYWQESIRLKNKDVWLPAVLQVLDLSPNMVQTVALESSTRQYAEADIVHQNALDATLLEFFIHDLLPDLSDWSWDWATQKDNFLLAEPLSAIDKAMREHGLIPAQDFSHVIDARLIDARCFCRPYVGAEGCFALLMAKGDFLELMFISEREGGAWVITGNLERFAKEIAAANTTNIYVQSMDESLADIVETHIREIELLPDVKAGPGDGVGVVEAYDRLLTAIGSTT